MDYKQRVLIEFKINTENIAKLSSFLKSETVIETVEYELLQEQLRAMRNYNWILEKRLMLFLDRKYYFKNFSGQK